MTVNLVVSPFNNDISWLKNMHNIDNVHVYDKSKDDITIPRDLPLNFIKLPNIGCEHQSYLQYIVDNYDNLADVTIFSQGDPFVHLYMPNEHFLNLIKDKNYYKFKSGYIDILGGFIDSDIYGRSSVQEQFKLNCKSFANIFDIELLDSFLYQSNGIFGATKECLHSIRKEVWSSINKFIKNDCTLILPDNSKLYLWINDSVYIMERMWFTLLNKSNDLPEIYKRNNLIHPYGFNKFI